MIGASSKSYNFEITTSQLCNLTCSYCFEDKAEGDIKQTGSHQKLTPGFLIKKIYELLESDFVNQNMDGYVHLIFWGGEPTQNLDLILTIVNEFVENPKVTFMLYTNGFLMKPYEEIHRLIKDVPGGLDKFDIQISYDGYVIHEKHRTIGKKGKTVGVVRKNIDKIYELGFPISLKATVPLDSFGLLPEVWDEHLEIFEKYKDDDRVSRETIINYCPTIDYSHGPGSGDLDYETWEKTCKELCKRELKFYKQYGAHLMTWFTETEPVRCVFPAYGSTLNVNGDIHYCHGEFYHNDKDSEVVTNLKDADYLPKMFQAAKDMQRINSKDYDTPVACDTCVATHCQQCNSVKRGFSDKLTFGERWMDFTNQPEMCTIYKIFGTYARALNKVKDK